MLFGAGWAITLAAWWLSARKSAARGAARAAGGNPHATAQSAVNRLREACRANDAAAAKQALLAWANARWPLTTPLGLCEIGERGGAELEARILELNAALYGSNPGSWQGLALWSAFNAVKDGRENAERSQADALEPLFKL